MKPEVGNSKILLTELISAGIAAATAIFLLLAAFDVFPFTIGSCWLIAVFICLFGISLVTALVQNNEIGTFFACVFCILAISQVFIIWGYSARIIYPIYIIAPILGVMIASARTQYALKTFTFCCVIAVAAFMLFLESASVLSVKIVLPMIALFLSICGAVYALLRFIKNKKEN